MRRAVAPLAVIAVLLLTAGSCQGPDCGALPPPTPEQRAAAAQVVGGEAVEVEVELESQDGATSECVVQGDRWVDLTDADE